jgi:predicted DCC family thiol-disulfide oxidoreductase YuxK
MHQWYLIYDDNCEVCNIGVARIRKLDKAGLIKLVPLSNPQVPSQIRLPSNEAMQKHMHLISPDGVTFKGADAVAEMLKIFPESKLVARIASFLPFRPIARLIYSIIAKNRMQISKLFSDH